jgi:hypothetical protein
MCEDFSQTLGSKELDASLRKHSFSHIFFSPGNVFTKNNMIVVPYFTVSLIEIKAERPPF